MKPCARFSVIKNNLENCPVVDNLILKQFEIKLNDEKNAVVEYKKVDNNTYDLVHSSIPEEYQGMGLGYILAQRIFDHLVSEANNIRVTCEFLHNFYEKNSEKYKAFVLN